MATRRYEQRFSGAASGVVVTTANSGDNQSGDILGSITTNSGTYDDSWKHMGATSLKIAAGPTLNGVALWNLSLGNRTGVFRGYHRFLNAPASDVAIFQFRHSGGILVSVMMEPDRQVRLAGSSTIYTTPTSLSADTTYRFEMAITVGNTQAENSHAFAVYEGDSDTAIHSSSGSNSAFFTNTAITIFRFGKLVSTPDYVGWFDDIVYVDGDTTFIGPKLVDPVVLSNGVEKPAILSVWSGGVEYPAIPELYRA